MTSNEKESSPDLELGASTSPESPQAVEIDSSNEKSAKKSNNKDAKDGDEKKEGQGSIRDYFVCRSRQDIVTLLTSCSASFDIVTDSTGLSMELPFSARWDQALPYP